MKQFITKKGKKKDKFESGFRKEIQSNKPRFDLILPENQKYEETMLFRLAMLMERGAKKYSDRNWEKACTKEELDRFKASAIRHFFQWFSNVKDGEDHASGVFFNIIAAEYVKRRLRR